MRTSKGLLFFWVVFWVMKTDAQNGYWQQRVKYVMNIDMDVSSNRFKGRQQLEYWNNSPDTLDKVYYHLFWNAFQPGSMMDERSKRQGTIEIGNKSDWDPRVKDRISNLKPDEIGYQKVSRLTMNGTSQPYEVQGTILIVKLTRPILPKQKVTFAMDFEAQVPLQIRRSGRDNPNTKVRYSMSQWYPKLSVYDKDGWHPTPYVGREFYGNFGDFDVNITIDKNYILGGTGYLTNANQIGYGYEAEGAAVTRPAGDKLTWKFTAPEVHDFMWAADPEFVHRSKKIREDLTLHLLYKPAKSTPEKWEKILSDAAQALPYIEKTFGHYPYKQYSFITGGDGGMEYPMATLLAAPGAWLHEWMHEWFYGRLATDETHYPWMDEGGADYADTRVSAWLNRQGVPGYERPDSTYFQYLDLVKSGKEEPLSTPADHFNTNFAYSRASYIKGSLFLSQLGYILGDSVRDRVLLNYYNQWKFKHPDANDFIRVAQKTSGTKLDWYRDYWIYSTKTIDYAIDSLWEEGGKTKIRLRNDGLMPMPVDFLIRFKDGTQELHNVPLDLMYNAKPPEDAGMRWKVYPPWPWTNKFYTIETGHRLMEIDTGEIDPGLRMADINRRNNKIQLRY
ncbi:M1 family metallopeptidase [Niabella beijingensis]|uniref:M1 family metallopeptidase n=1 Tax=Niabella beijingensis TaxID=2872700 RepID=UPI001CC06242|nr:M1 family metallopeptidase [Niabella beijingensis]MBZ4187770.1 M1 family metallopeptidase [Niabella beijingensis]